jgi:hypothetical protein
MAFADTTEKPLAAWILLVKISDAGLATLHKTV